MDNDGDLSVFQKFAAMVPKDDMAMGSRMHSQSNNATGSVGGMFSGGPGGGGNLIRPSPIPASAPTGRELLRGGGAGGNNQQQHDLPPHHHHQQQQQFGHPQHRAPRGPPLPVAQPGGGMAPGSAAPDLLQLIHHHPMNGEVLKRSEAVALQIAVADGHSTPAALLQRFAHGALQTKQRETLLMVLKVMQTTNRLPAMMTPELNQAVNMVAPPGAMQHSSRHQPQQQQQQRQQQQQSVSPSGQMSDISAQLAKLQQHQHQQEQQQQQQQRISPSSMFQAAAAADGNKNSRSSLSVSPAPPGGPGQPQRVPSPQELVYHAQQIMQNALIKRKLEEQKENYRRRQEHFSGTPQQQQQQMRDRSNSDAKESPAAAATPLAFTPMAVMKKMAAERRDSDPRPQIPELRISQGDNLHQDLHEQQQDNLNLRFKDLKLDPVTAAAAAARTSPISPQNVPLPPPNPLIMLQLQQQQQAAALQHLARQQHNDPMATAAALNAMQQQAAQAAAGLVGSISGDSGILPDLVVGAGHHGHGHGMVPRQQQPGIMEGLGGIIPSSSSSSSLSQFFSPEVLAQASSGNAPSMPPLPTQKALTLEEIELQAAAAVRM